MKTFLCAIVLGASFIGAAATACSTTTTSATSVPEAGAADASKPADASVPDAADSGSDAGGACNSVVNGGGDVQAASVKSAAPTATGGTIADGTYFQTEFNLYDPGSPAEAPAASGMISTLVIKGNSIESIIEFPDGSSETYSETFSVSGSKLMRNLTCPKTSQEPDAAYSVSGATFTIYETDAKSSLVGALVYVKQ